MEGACAASTMAADAVQPTRSPLSRFGAAERRSREHGNDQMHDCQRANMLPTMPRLANLLQPPSAAQAAKPVVEAPASGCQLQQRSQGGFGIKEMLTRGDSKVCDGRRT